MSFFVSGHMRQCYLLSKAKRQQTILRNQTLIVRGIFLICVSAHSVALGKVLMEKIYTVLLLNLTFFYLLCNIIRSFVILDRCSFVVYINTLLTKFKKNNQETVKPFCCYRGSFVESCFVSKKQIVCYWGKKLYDAF